MAVDADLVDDIAAQVSAIYAEAEAALLRLTARQINNGLARQRLADIRALRRGAQAIVTGLEADTGPAIRDALAAAYRHGWGNAVADLPEQWFPASGIGQAAREAARERSGTGFVEALAESLIQDVGRVTSNILRNVEDAYRRVQAAAAARILTGAQTRRDAAQAAWQGLVDRGLTSFTDKSGRRWRLSSYVEMATRTNAQRAAVTGQVDRLDAVGVNLVYVSNSPQECKACRPFEGKILRTDDGPLRVQVEHATRDIPATVTAYDTLDGARSKGLFHPNCRHSVSAYLPGVSRPPQRTADPEGNAARQKQRALERKIRRAKEQQEAALTPEAKKAAGRKVRATQAELRQHLADNPKLKRLPYRERIGAGNIPPRGQGDAAGALGQDQQPDLFGGADPISRRRVADEQADRLDDRAPIEGQRAIDDGPELENLTDAELEERLMAIVSDEDRMEEFERIAAEIDRREQLAREVEERRARDRARAQARAERQAEEQAQRMMELLEEGWDEEEAVQEVYGIAVEQQRRDRAIGDLRAQGYTGRSFEELARASYKEHVRVAYLDAEAATNGYLVNAEGRARGIDPRDLFTGPEARARRWASDELKGWWDQHGRMTFEDWKAQLLDRRHDGGSGRDFLA